MYEQDLALNNLRLLICHKTQPNQTYVKGIALPVCLCLSFSVTVCLSVCVNIYIYIYIVILRDTKLIRSKEDFVSWNFRTMRQDLLYKWRKLLQPPKAVVENVNIIPTRINMFVNDNIVIYVNVKKQ